MIKGELHKAACVQIPVWNTIFQKVKKEINLRTQTQLEVKEKCIKIFNVVF